MPTHPSFLKPIWPARWWWGVLLIILTLAGALRYTGYNFGLPYVDHVDEPAYYLAGRMMIDFGSAKPLGMQGYPPGIVTLNYVLLKLFQDPSAPPSSLLGPLRLISITFSMLTLLVIALLGYRSATPLAGLIAAGVWTFVPLVVEHSRYGTADNFVTFFTLAALFFSLTGTLYDRDRWTTYAIVAIMFAIVFKYQAVFVLPIVGALPLCRLWRVRHERPAAVRIIKNSINHLIILGFFFLWLLLLFPALEANEAPDWSAANEKLGIPSIAEIKSNFHTLFDLLWSAANLWRLGALGLAGLLWPRFRKQLSLLSLAALLATGVFWWVGVSFYGSQFFRQFITSSAISVIGISIGLGFWAEAFAYGLERLNVSTVHRGWLSAAILGVLLINLNWSHIDASIANARDHTLHDRRNDLATYMDTSVMPGPYIGDSDMHKVFNGAWGGYAGKHEFPLAAISLVTDRPLDEWRALGVQYAILPYYVYNDMKVSASLRESYLNQMLLLKSYPPSTHYRGPSMVVFRLTPFQHEATGSLGPISLIGYDIDHTEVASGGSLTFTLYWQSADPLGAEYVVYNHLAPLESRDIIGQIDGPPLNDERRSTQSWTDPNEVLVSRPFTLTIGADVPPGTYRLITGFYRRDTWERLQTPAGDDYLLVTTVTVKEPDRGKWSQ